MKQGAGQGPYGSEGLVALREVFPFCARKGGGFFCPFQGGNAVTELF